MNHERILILGDLHFPFNHKKALSWVFETFIKSRALKPDIIIQIGDLYDLYAMSKFPRNPNIYTPAQEIIEGRDCAIEMWDYIRRKCRSAQLIQLLGNHDTRMSKRILEALPELCDTVSLSALWNFEGVHTVHDDRQEFLIGDTVFLHGFYSGTGKHVRHNLRNTVLGHTHRGGTVFHPVQNTVLWELNAGYLGDPHSKALSYTKQTWTNWTLGVGYIDELGPRFIPYPSSP